MCPAITLAAMHVHRPRAPPLAPAGYRSNIGRIGPARDLGRPEAGACRPCVRAPVPPGGAPPAARRRRPPWGSTSPCPRYWVLLGCKIRANSLRGPRKSAARRLPGPTTTQHIWGGLRGRRSRSHRTKHGHGVLERLTCELLVPTGALGRRMVSRQQNSANSVATSMKAPPARALWGSAQHFEPSQHW